MNSSEEEAEVMSSSNCYNRVMWPLLQGSCHRAGHCDIQQSGRTTESLPTNTVVVVIAVFPRAGLFFSWFRSESHDASSKKVLVPLDLAG